jgi:NTP pyrophosphatase (non-canonical NTP hydrolase)
MGDELASVAGGQGALTVAGFQRHIKEKYGVRDAERGTPATYMWFIEEVGELASALQDIDHKNKEEEFADVLAWLCTLANINGVDLTKALENKYFKDGGPKGFK